MHQKIKIPYNKPHLTGDELTNIRKAHSLRQLAGDGYFTGVCHQLIEKTLRCQKSLLTHSCTAAIEMMALLSDVKSGDEIIMPSYTFASTANGFVLRGAKPVFIDVRSDTLNIDEKLIEMAITRKTKAIVPVHYAGVACNMDPILALAKKYKLLVLEDAAQAFLSTYKDRYLGTIGDMAALSFHETKNVISGEGGAILLNKTKYIARAEIIREKGTNRTRFFQGRIKNYTWIDIGSSYLPGEIISSFLMAQLKHARNITNKRRYLWDYYHVSLFDLEQQGHIRRPIIPKETQHNGHLYYILTNTIHERKRLISLLEKRGILAITHYTPLHSSPAGRKFTRYVGDMKVTKRASDQLVRLPLFLDIKQKEQAKVVQSIYDFYNGRSI